MSSTAGLPWRALGMVRGRRDPPAEARATSSNDAVSEPPFLGRCNPVTDYEKLAKIGEGTYGMVYKARHVDTNEIVALKKIKIERDVEREGMPLTAFREIQLLTRYRHRNVVELKEVVVGAKMNSVFLVCEYWALVDSMRKRFAVCEIKCLLHQTLTGLDFMHHKYIIHRDLKLSNLLYTNRGEVKICDFGLARRFGYPPRRYSPKVLTLWYRPPELLLGESVYTTGVDMWAIGCIFGELLNMAPLLPGKTEVMQLGLIFELLGSPNSRIWPGFETLPNVQKFSIPQIPYSSIRHQLPGLTDSGYHLLERLLTYDPQKRVSAAEALDHPFFQEAPRMLDLALMPTFPTLHGTSPKTASSAASPSMPKAKRQKMDW